ncbi:hypothetical protein A8F94_00410 [Bacillus sp. FJAT-27225]|uniref:hypothetical protein n=1 Tax=Bacillus sp. FJAT-27225 TaxID=1743144 RepID=UPI00080C2B4E|nr:hypothetical protein [Bacillus sp. FJAT-27225]OCA90395.1 hypothetical protein A8F94_00410 [Bacillus sp. FJAT-27225]
MSLERRFHQAMIGVYTEALKQCNYKATRFLQMVSNEGGLKTAKKLLSETNKVSDGFMNLLEHNRLDLTVEALVLNEKFQPLFTEAEINEAKYRLEQYHYKPTNL